MGAAIKYKYGTEAQILALTTDSAGWVDRAFYYPEDKNYFYQALNGEMKVYGAGNVSIVGLGITLNEKIIGGVKTLIEQDDILNIPENWDYNTKTLTVAGEINCYGDINIM